MPAPDVIVANGTKHCWVTVPEIRDGSQLTLLTVISVFGDSTDACFILQSKTCEKKQFWGFNSYLRALIMRLDWHRKLS
jgi:hypothetical protein